MDERNAELARLDDPDKTEEKCYVYIIATTTGAYKVGVANDPKSRHNSLHSGIPDPSEIKLTILCKGRKHALAVERGIHQQLDQYRSSGEWFRPPREVLAELVLELGSRIDALASGYSVLEYPIKKRQVELETEPFEPAIGQRRCTWDRTKSVIEIIRGLQAGQNVPVSLDLVLEGSEEMGIGHEKAEDIINRMRRDGDILEVMPGMLKLPADPTEEEIKRAEEAMRRASLGWAVPE